MEISGEDVRILVIDDEPAMHDAYRRTFSVHQAERDEAGLRVLASELFGSADDASSASAAQIDDIDAAYADQGIDGLRLVAQSLRDNNPFQVAFIDIRMPPGIDGKETAKRIREIDPNINLVIVTGYSDYSAIDIAKVAGPIDKLFYVSKPFDPEEVAQTARALGHRWFQDQELARVQAELASKVEHLERQRIQLAANEARATHMATHDALTGTANRFAFLRALKEAIGGDKSPIAVAIVDLDRFKNVNDTLGHFAGDELIRQVCLSMAAVIGNKGLVARLGGDEFAIAIAGLDETEVKQLCSAVVEASSQDFTVFGHQVQISASIGLIVASKDVVAEPIDLLRFADIALYAAKRAGGNQTRLFDSSMDESVRFRQTIEDGLRHAIAQDELHLLFQPIVDRDNQHIAGFEALLRWTSPQHGPVSPAVFIPVAEESTLIHEIGDWAAERALLACKNWPEQYVSINYSPRQFLRDDFAERLVAQAQRLGVDPSRVQIEITETAIFDDNGRAAATLAKLREAKFRIALDDFGTGYSSLFNIRNFALDCIKIDKSFVENMGREPQSAAIIHSVVHLARSLGLAIVAEGVETELQFQSLRMAGCTHMQGYMFSPPVDAETVATLIADRNDAQRGSVSIAL